MKVDWEVYGLELDTPLQISRSVMSRRDAVRVVVEHDGQRGHGEVVTSTYYRLDVEAITSLLERLRPVLAAADSPETALDALHADPIAAGVRAAVDAALHDLIGLRRGLPVHALTGLPDWHDTPTAYTIGITTPDDAAIRAAALAGRGFSVLKVKAGADPDQDVATAAAVRAAAPDARIVLDPNGGWSPGEAVRVIDRITAADVVLAAVEQPIPPGDPDGLAWVRERCPAPLVADEDAATVDDVRRLAGAVDGVNVKLAKCGGLRPALEIVSAARDGGLDVMLGCLVASSLGIAPAVHLAGHARWVDLDGHLLLAHDPWVGIGGEDGVLRLSGEPGLGVVRR
ncbi:L-alanine-DL-glutamate epimerase-like enolase superfamily enzyme [Lentzea atacamensis]|uniref:Dipeptide epimerase n=1 Tax=Lentzea atacamensis TaxID=531938 RepID=A0A316HMR1_9PSEU|nr:dipeptide epimerase [Lentzea atacamensis]PWK81300.1 L-alanine-DL-glutamate epimerase-like enolase superfamily enzyme [Lentzea atacamensis]